MAILVLSQVVTVMVIIGDDKITFPENVFIKSRHLIEGITQYIK